MTAQGFELLSLGGGMLNNVGVVEPDVKPDFGNALAVAPDGSRGAGRPVAVVAAPASRSDRPSLQGVAAWA